MKSSLKETVLYTVLCSTLIGVGVGYAGGQYLNKQSDEQSIEREEASSKLLDEAFGIDHEATAQDKSLDHAENWTFRMTRMPNIPERTDMANSLLKALDDNIISDDEHKMLTIQFDQLGNTVINQRTKNNAAKIAAGEDIVVEGDNAAVSRALKEYAYQQWVLNLEADRALRELRKINEPNH